MVLRKDLVKLMLMGMLTSSAFMLSGCSDDDDVASTAIDDSSDKKSAKDGEYNINNYLVDYNGKKISPITKDNWREADGIFLYVGDKGDGGIHDTNNAGGYAYVHLPWHKGNVQTNLPNGFCENLTPENGWEWALNCCGNRSIANGNFFALYNKWTGVLRFFYYMPGEFATGNDHVWEVALSNGLANHKPWGFGLPSDETPKDRSKLSAVGAGTQVDYVTPWFAMKSKDGLIVPNTGWWAFDVDLSLYRPDVDNSNDNIRLQMRSWNNQHVSLFSTLAANIDGDIKQQLEKPDGGPSASSVSQGICTTIGAGLKLASSIVKFKDGNIADGLGGLADIFGLGGEFAGLFGEEDEQQPFEAKVNLSLNGTIDTDGLIQGSTPTVGVASPTFHLKDFDQKNSHVGQGVWNIKNHPVVDVFASYLQLYSVDKLGSEDLQRTLLTYIFDPSSIEVELNPEVFPESEVEWMQVDATCVATKSMGMYGTDTHRQAFGLTPIRDFNTMDNHKRESVGVIGVNGFRCYGFSTNQYPCDYLFYSEDKSGLDFPIRVLNCTDNGFITVSGLEVIGRGIKDKFAIEPLVFRAAYLGYELPALTVNVVVSVKMKGMAEPIQFSRNYLPKIKYFSAGKMDEVYQNICSHKLNAKQSGHTKSYDYQVKRIGKLFEIWKTQMYEKEHDYDMPVWQD